MDYKLIISSDGGSIDLYNDPDIFIRDMDGISPEVANNCSELYGGDGAIFNSANLPARHISLVIQFYNRDVEAARLRLFKVLDPKGEIKLRYISPCQDRYIMARLEDAPIVWGSSPVKGQIKLICPDPYWRKSGNNCVVIAGTQPCFEFPLIIDEISEDSRFKSWDHVVISGSGTLLGNTDDRLIDMTIYGKSTQDGTPTPENPVDIVSVGDGGSVGITACGKNLLNPTLRTTTINGVTCTSNGDGTYTLNGTATAKAGFHLIPTNELRKLAKNYIGKSLRFVGCPHTGDYTTYALIMQGLVADGENERDIGNGCTIENVSYFTNFEKVYIYIIVKSGCTVDNVVFKPMITTDLNATYDDYEPYKGSTASITTTLPLCGIPVDSGGNYTDKDGQQWVCDELIYNADGTGKIVKRCDKTKLTSANITGFVEHKNLGNYFYTNVKSINVDDQSSLIPISNAFKGIKFGDRANSDYLNKFRCFISSDGRIMLRNSAAENDKFTSLADMQNFVDSNDVYIVYPLATLQEIELTAAEMSALRQLQTFEGVTNISNSGGADMRIGYYFWEVYK